MMSNEQKAKEIAAKYCEYYDGSKEADSTSYNSAMEMAKYKDEEIKKLKKEIADGEKFREELKRLCNERLDNRIALENELEEYKDETPISEKWLYKNFPLCSNYCHYYYDYEDDFSIKINETIGEIRFVEVENKIDGKNYHHECVIKTVGQLRMFLTLCGLTYEYIEKP